jgi:hypothetical protein
METIKLKLSEVLTLKNEIFGLQNQSTGEVLTQGLLKQALSYPVKYWLHNLGNKLTAEETLVNKLRDELILKHGETDANGGVSVPVSVEDGVEILEDGTEKKLFKINPKFIEFQQEFDAVLKEEKEIEYKPFKLEDLKTIVTDEDYAVFNKLVIE